jgi:hypothetical protein
MFLSFGDYNRQYTTCRLLNALLELSEAKNLHGSGEKNYKEISQPHKYIFILKTYLIPNKLERIAE